LEKEPLIVISSIFSLLTDLMVKYVEGRGREGGKEGRRYREGKGKRKSSYSLRSGEARSSAANSPAASPAKSPSLDFQRTQKKLESDLTNTKTTIFWKKYIANQNPSTKGRRGKGEGRERTGEVWERDGREGREAAGFHKKLGPEGRED
jgi:hypothetical protein